MFWTRVLGERRVVTIEIGRVRVSARRATLQWSRFAVCRDSRSWWPFVGAIYLPFAVVTIFTRSGGER